MHGWHSVKSLVLPPVHALSSFSMKKNGLQSDLHARQNSLL